VEQVVTDVKLVEVQRHDEGGEGRRKEGRAEEGEREVRTSRNHGELAIKRLRSNSGESSQVQLCAPDTKMRHCRPGERVSQ